MTTMDIARQTEAEDLSRARELVQMILHDWDLMTWNELLAEDVVLLLNLGSIGTERLGELSVVDGRLQTIGLESATRTLRGFL